MKKIMPYILLMIAVTSLFILIINKTKINDTKVITVNTLHSYLYTNAQLIEIPIFVTGENEVIKEIKSYDNTYIFNDDGKKLMLELKDITFSHSEKYLNETYDKFIIKFSMPNLMEDFYIENAYLSLTFIDQTKIDLKIGEFHLSYITNNGDINWESIDSKRLLENTNKLQMDYIVVEFTEIPIDIESIYIDSFNKLEYEIIGNELYVKISEDALLINYVPLIIKLNSNKHITFNNHHYSIEYNLLERAGREMNIYVLD